MNENLKTIKELADELGVSKQTIRNKIDKDFREKFVQTIKIKGNNTLVINNAGYSLLKKTLQNDTAQTKLICFLEEQLDKKEQQLSVKDKQLENKDTQISQMQNLLDQQQRLALQDKKLLEEYKSEIKELKSLMVPVRKDDKDPMVQKSKDIDNTKEELHKKNKKWWHFGRNVK